MIKHGFAVRVNGMPSRVYGIWCQMIQRCHNPKNWAYKYYGGKGVSVCERWRKFENFWEDVKSEYRDDLTIHRKENSVGYCASNCSWVDMKTQAWHTSKTRNVTIDGITKPITVWARDLGMDIRRVYKRMKAGWNEIEALTKPLQKWTRHNES